MLRAKGRPLADGGPLIAGPIAEAKLSRFIKADLEADRFSWSLDEQAVMRAELFDGNLALLTNTPDLTPAETVKHYKALADIERGFRVLKSDIEIAPVHHRLPDRIRAHALICFLALVLYRVMRMRQKLKNIVQGLVQHSIFSPGSKNSPLISVITPSTAPAKQHP